MTHRQKILVVDGEPAFCRLMLMTLSTQGYDVLSAASGQEALTIITSSVDLVLLDLTLPDSDGLKICRMLKTNEETKHIPVIILNGRKQNGDRVESFHLGADDYLTKPFETEELFVRVEAALSRTRRVLTEDLNSTYDIIQELNHIVDHEHIVPFFQPIYLLNPRTLFGLEVLSRPQTAGVLSNPETLFKAALRYCRYFE
jgi:DNA-binding response OmpR family regulator